MSCHQSGSIPGTSGGSSPRWDAALAAYLVVLDDTGGYLIVPDTSWHSGGACPGLDDYPNGTACAELAQPPPGWTTCSRGISYGEALYQWYTLGQPADWDTDGDGWPCEDAYPQAGVYPDADSLLRP